MLSKTIQSGDWKGEKHVPHINLCEQMLSEGKICASVKVGEEIAHPNTPEHHIAWLKLFFQPDGAKFPVEVASYNASAHGESEITTEPVLKAVFAKQAGILYAVSYCNIHGLWESELRVD